MIAQDLTLRLGTELYSKKNIKTCLETYDRNIKEEDKILTLHKEVLQFLIDWFSDKPFMEIQTSGSTGTAKRIKANKMAMLHSAEQTCKALNLQEGDMAILCISPKYIGGMMMVVRAMLQKMKLILAPIQANPLISHSISIEGGSPKNKVFIALVPMQVQSILSNKKSKDLFKQIDKVIIGGASLNTELIEELQDYPNDIYSSYGMTETLSHIALSKLSARIGNKRYYPLDGVKLALSEEGSLNILAPYISDEWLETNDLVQFYEDGSFEILGRKDNVVNSGGIKLQIEQLEEIIRRVVPHSIALTSIPNKQLGEALVLLIEKEGEDYLEEENIALLSTLKEALPAYSSPKHIIYCNKLPLTPNGKINRQACKDLANNKSNRP